MRATIVAVLLALSAATAASAEDKPALREIDRVRLAEAFAIGEQLQDKVWKDWSKAPFAVLLVTADHEFLIRHPKPSPDFVSLGHDALLKSDVYVRPRAHQPDLLATFPAIPGSMVSTIVIGQAENTTKRTSTPWVVTVLHEHFHQLQNSQPTYFADVEGLNLSRGDQTGMWMLNFPFPYDTPELAKEFSALGALLAEALEQPSKTAAYLAARRKIAQSLGTDDYKYFSFQVWQEGIARYTEYRIASLAAKRHKPSAAFTALSDYKPLKEVAGEIKSGIVRELTHLDLPSVRRVAFYPIGAGEGLLLDKVKPGWQQRYFTDKFDVEKCF
jgi:hypothetical protein